jgi:hypothetical protein
MTTEYESQEFKANFVTACQCEGFMQTLEFVNNLFSEAEKNGREYGWVDDYDYYWLPEKAHLDYEFICPRFEIVESQIVLKPSIGATYETIAHILVNGNDIKMPFGYFHQTSGDFNQKELSLFAFSISYLRFRERDGMRNADVEKWNKVVESNIVSIDTVLVTSR